MSLKHFHSPVLTLRVMIGIDLQPYCHISAFLHHCHTPTRAVFCHILNTVRVLSLEAILLHRFMTLLSVIFISRILKYQKEYTHKKYILRFENTFRLIIIISLDRQKQNAKAFYFKYIDNEH
jgi:Na+/H+ antiporter NhaD/arsenite permease-like protein